MNTQLDAAIELLALEVVASAAKCVIVDEGFPSESSLFGTRDGYINLAISLLRFVSKADVDDPSVSGIDAGCKAFGDDIKRVMYQLPTDSAWIVGLHMFDSHRALVSGLSRIVDSQITHPLLNDPQFTDPSAMKR